MVKAKKRGKSIPQKKGVKKKAKKKVLPVSSLRKTAKKFLKSKKKGSKAPRTPPPKAPVVLGRVTHFYSQINVGVVEIKKEIRKGDSIVVSGHGKMFSQIVGSMQVEHEPVSVAKKGQVIGMKFIQPVKDKDLVLQG